MRNLKLFSLFFFVFSALPCMAQQTNAQKIMGCWSLSKMEFNDPANYNEQIAKDALKHVICFENGKFTTTKVGTNEVMRGVYSISADGKTISQSREESDEGIDDDAQIILLDDKKLQLKSTFVTLYFDRK